MHCPLRSKFYGMAWELHTCGRVWARSYCTSVQESIKKQTEQLKNKQAAELAAFEDELKVLVPPANAYAFDGKTVFAAVAAQCFLALL